MGTARNVPESKGVRKVPIVKSLSAYRNEKKNCAQSILVGFRDACGVPEAEIDAARTAGGGRAEGGLCGALYAALRLSGENETKQTLQRQFVEKAGSERCSDIRQLKKLSCAECVELAATVLSEQEHWKKNQ
jgi:hypothetical protein